MKYYFTFLDNYVLNDQSLGNRYVIFKGDYYRVRQEMFNLCGFIGFAQYEESQIKELEGKTEITQEELKKGKIGSLSF